MDDDRGSDWPPHRFEVRPWRQATRGGTREDRTLSAVQVALPPHVAGLSPLISARLAAELEAAMSEITALDRSSGTDLAALGMLLLRTESVASSKIEAVEASLDDYARALHGSRANASAVSMVAATDALELMVGQMSRRGALDLETILQAHAALMRDDPREAAYAGRCRDMQNWVGGSDFSPRGALFVPPPPEEVEAYLRDLLVFANRDDIPVLAQAAVVHAQFESIHPFTDGNGRVGRALINSVLRLRGATTSVVVPLASALVAHRDGYFDLLGAYRSGDLAPLIGSFAQGARIAAAESRVTAGRLASVPQQWRDALGPVRRGSAVAKLLDLLPANPVLSADQALAAVDSPQSSVYAALARLRDAGVLRPLVERKREQVWGAGLVLDELDDLGVRIAAAAHEARPRQGGG